MKKLMRRNIRLFYAYKIFTKRVYFPVIAIFAADVAGLSLSQIGLIASIATLFLLIVEVPSGYWSDKLGHRNTLVLGMVFGFFAPISYLVAPNFAGLLVASLFFYGSYAIGSGTTSAFLYETLETLGKEGNYTKIRIQSQSFSLIFNMIFLATVPATYAISPKLPFILGAVAMGIGTMITLWFTQPPQTQQAFDRVNMSDFFELLKKGFQKGYIYLFFAFGVLAALNAGGVGRFRELYYQAMSVPVEYYGIIAAVASGLAVGLGFLMQRMKDWSIRKFLGFEIIYVVGSLIFIGLMWHPLVVIALFTLYLAYMRHRFSLIDTYSLRILEDKRLKATFISLVGFAERLVLLIIPLTLGILADSWGLGKGALVIAAGVFVLAVVFTRLYMSTNKKHLAP